MKKLFSITLFLPLFAFASSGTYELLAPLGPLSGSVTLSDYLNGIMQVVIGVAGILAVVMIVKSGIELIGSPSVSKRSEVRATIGSAILGLILAMGSWVILNTINSDLLKKDITIGNVPAPVPLVVKTIDAPLPPDSKPGWYYRYREAAGKPIWNSPSWRTAEMCLNAMNLEKSSGIIIEKTNAGNGPVECFLIPMIAGNEAQNRNSICGNSSCAGAVPVAVKQGPCPATVRDCTKPPGYINVAGMPQSAIDGIKALARDSSQNVIITGGTESGHKSHKPNSPIFDLSKTKGLDAWIRKTATQSTASFAPYCRYPLTFNTQNSGSVSFWFTDEGDHWHVCQKDQPFWYCNDYDQSRKELPGGFVPLCPSGSGGGSSRSGSSGGGSAGSSGSSGGSSGSGGSLPVCATPPTGPNCVCPSTAYPNMGNDGWYCP